MKPPFHALVLFAALSASSGALAQADAYRYSGQRAGGPANDLAPIGQVRPAKGVRSDPAYRHSGTRAGGPAADLAPRSTQSSHRSMRAVNPAYRFSGSHAGGPANGLNR
jgi:hypothetical protein